MGAENKFPIVFDVYIKPITDAILLELNSSLQTTGSRLTRPPEKKPYRMQNTESEMKSAQEAQYNTATPPTRTHTLKHQSLLY
mmetsp:Transcript_9525/g.14334  ORF Transcript_9525/g.14334 Transcript_9525/m.14334 type:complete len:83 (+) Transcript_9525:328-576(+)